MKKPSILVCGNTTMDIVTVCDLPYNKSGKRKVSSCHFFAGGQAANTAYTLANLGNHVSFIGAIGHDTFANTVRNDFQEDSIDITRSTFCKAPQHIGFIRVDQLTGERYIDMYRDSLLRVDTQNVQDEWVGLFDCIYNDGHEPEASLYISGIAKNLRIPVILDLEEVNHHAEPLIKRTDILIAPHQVIEALRRPMEELFSFGLSAVILTKGRDGAEAYISGQRSVEVHAHTVDVVDTTGAGDAFHAGFVHALLRRQDIVSCLKFANLLGAEKCLHLGPRIPRESLAKYRTTNTPQNTFQPKSP